MHIPTYFLFDPAFNTRLNQLLCLYILGPSVRECVIMTHQYFKGTVALDVNGMKAMFRIRNMLVRICMDPLIRNSA